MITLSLVHGSTFQLGFLITGFLVILSLWTITDHTTLEDITPSMLYLPSTWTTKAVSVKNDRQQQLKHTCQLVAEGRYALPTSQQKHPIIISDNHHKVRYCPIPKVGTSNWNRLFYLISERERSARLASFNQSNMMLQREKENRWRWGISLFTLKSHLSYYITSPRI